MDELLFRAASEGDCMTDEELTADDNWCPDCGHPRGACCCVPPVYRTARVLTDGSPVTDDHREIDPRTGQQKGYVVLTAVERSKGMRLAHKEGGLAQ
jgi:hypothetical protein